jgi:hypothetical protein
MNDLQNVVGRLDDLLMVIWAAGCVLIFAVALVKNFSPFDRASRVLTDLLKRIPSSKI